MGGNMAKKHDINALSPKNAKFIFVLFAGCSLLALGGLLFTILY